MTATRLVECSPCPAVQCTGNCDHTTMWLHARGHAWCAGCGGRREVGSQILPEHPTPPHPTSQIVDLSKLLK